MSESTKGAAWALPQLLRALWQGHPSHRGRVLRLIASQSDEILSREPVTSAFRRILSGGESDQVRRLGELISSRGLSAYGADLVDLLRGERRELAIRWLRRARFPFPKAELLRLIGEVDAPVQARREALRLLARRGALSRDELLALLPCFAEPRLHGPLLELLEPHADEAMVGSLVQANRAFGESLLRQRRREKGLPEEPGLLYRLLFVGDEASSVGEFVDTRREQRPFIHGLAHLSAAAGSETWLAALLPYLWDGAITERLTKAYAERRVSRVAAPLLHLHAPDGQRLAVKIELLGKLEALQAKPLILKSLPAFGRDAGATGKAAILALARLGERVKIGPYLAGALAAMRESLGQPPQGTPGHPSTWSVAFQAAAELNDERFGAIGLELLGAPGMNRVLVELDVIFAECLTRLAPLELEPMVRRVLCDEPGNAYAQRLALEVVERKGLRGLLPQLVALSKRMPTMSSLGAKTLRKMLRVEDGALAREFFEGAQPDDATASRLLERCEEVLGSEDLHTVAGLVLERGVGGAKTQRAALRLLGSGDAAALLERCVALLRSPHGKVVSAALREALRLGVLAPEKAGPYTNELLRLARRALERAPQDDDAKAQLKLLLDALVPKAGIPGRIEPEAAEELRGRLYRVGLWTELPTFMSMHRELLDRTLAGHDLSLFHGALLGSIGPRTFFHPITMKKGPYPGPLPRFDDTFASPSPFVQEGLWDVVCGPGYLRTQRLTLHFLESPRPRVRAGALSRLGRETCLGYSDVVLARATDDHARVRKALVELLQRHELSRFADDLEPLLDDPDEGVRLLATRVLGGWGDTACLPRMVAFLESDDPPVRREAARVLASYEPNQLRGLLAPLVSVSKPLEAAAAMLALRPTLLPDDEDLKAALFAVAAKGRGPLRALALRFLPALGDERRLGQVVPLLADAQPDVRKAAAWVLARRDGRRHAPAIAQLASDTDDTTIRLEVLGLLAELGVPEATRALLPLLLDEDPRVRQATAAAAATTRGFSLQPELVAVLEQGLEGKTSPDGIRELVDLLHRDGDEDAFPAIAKALRCEDRPVWEAVIRAARARGRDDHLPILGGLLQASPPLAAHLLTLAVSELERLADGQRREKLPETARALARAASAETLKRRALLAAFRVSGDEDVLAKELLDASLGKLATLQKSKQKKEKDTRREMARVAGTATTSAWVLAARHKGTSAELTKALKALPDGAWRGTLPWRFLEWSLEVAASEGQVSKGLVGALALIEQNPSDKNVKKPSAATRLVRGLRDRIEPREWLRLFDALGPADTADLARSRLVAQLLHQEDSLEEHRRRLQKASEEAFPLVRQVYLEAMEVVRPELRPLLATVIGELKRRKVDLNPSGWWQRRQAEELWKSLVSVKLRLGVREGSDVLNELRPDGRAALMTAEDDVAGLATLLEKDADESSVILQLAEIGDAEAARELSKHVGHRKPEFRVRVAHALGQCRDADAARGGVRALLSDDQTTVLAAALEAVAALGDEAHAEAVLRGLADERDEVVGAATKAATALRLRQALPILRSMLTGDHGGRRKLALKAAAELADGSMLTELVETAKQGLNAAEVDQAAAALELALGKSPSEAQLDQVGALLGESDAMAQRVALKIVASRVFTKAAPGVRAMITSGSAAIQSLACEAALALKDSEALGALREAMKLKGSHPGTHSFRYLNSDVQVAALRLFAGVAKSEADRAELRGHCVDALEERRLVPYATEVLAELSLDDELEKKVREAVLGLIKSGWSESEGLQRAFRALRKACPEAVARMAPETAWDRIVKGRGGGAFQDDMLAALAEWLQAEGAPQREEYVAQALALVDFDRTRNRMDARVENGLLRLLWTLAPAQAAPWIRRQLERDASPELLELYTEVLKSEHAHPEFYGRLRSGLVHNDLATRQKVRTILREAPAQEVSGSFFDEVMTKARANDPLTRALAGLFVHGPWGRAFAGDLMVALHRAESEAAQAAVWSQLGSIQPNTWPGFKRIYKLNERDQDVKLFTHQAWVLDQGSIYGNPSFRTCQYMQRRTYRQLKGVGLDHPERFFELVSALLGRFAEHTRRGSLLLPRLLRAAPSAAAGPQRFEVKLENPFAAAESEADSSVPDRVDMNAEELLAPPPIPEPPARQETKRTQAWKGPLFAELWTREPTRLVELLGGKGHSEQVQQVALGLLRERVGERILQVPLETFYGLLTHPSRQVFAFALGQVAARARRELIRFGELIAVFERLVKERTTDWDALADVLWVLDDERATAERAGLAEPLRDLLIKQRGAPGIGPVVAFFREHFAAKLGPPLFDWNHALSLAQAARPDVRELARDLVAALGKAVALGASQVPQLLGATPLLEDAPDLVHEILTGSPAKPGGYRPVVNRGAQGTDWTTSECVRAVESLGDLGYVALRRALLHFEEEGGLPPQLGRSLIASSRSTRRSRALGMELLGSALDRGAATVLELTDYLTGTFPEDVVTWAGGRMRDSAEKGALPNEALYRLLDTTHENVNEYARELVRDHLQRFEVAELIVFCAESPDATTSDLGIQLYESELRDAHGFDLKQLLPMFRILLFKVARSRQEKNNLLGTLRRWALQAPENAALVIDVLAAFRRSEAKIDFAAAMTLLATLGERFPGAVAMPFETSTSFGHVKVGAV